MVLFINFVKKKMRALREDLSDYTDYGSITQIRSLLKKCSQSLFGICLFFHDTYVIHKGDENCPKIRRGGPPWPPS